MTARIALLVTCVLLAGCGTVIDGSKVERDLKKRFATTGVDLKSVKCPSGMTVKKGDTFSCKVTGGDGTTLDIKLVEDDDKGHVAYVTHVANHDEFESGVADVVAKNTGVDDVEVSCPDLVEQRKGATLRCTATSGNDTLDLRVVQTNDSGAYRVERN